MSWFDAYERAALAAGRPLYELGHGRIDQEHFGSADGWDYRGHVWAYRLGDFYAHIHPALSGLGDSGYLVEVYAPRGMRRTKFVATVDEAKQSASDMIVELRSMLIDAGKVKA